MNTRTISETNSMAQSSAVRSPLQWIMMAFETRSQRRVLSELDDDALKDLGICEADRDHEVQRHFWDI